jgi:hypothetical protein
VDAVVDGTPPVDVEEEDSLSDLPEEIESLVISFPATV